MDRSLSRRRWLTALASGAGALLVACQSSGSVTELNTPEGRVLQYEADDLIILVSGFQPSYRVGDALQVNLMVNNQTRGEAQVKLRTKLLGQGGQPVVQAEPAVLSVKPQDASSVDQTLPLGRNLVPGSYTLSVEVPPWRLNGRESGPGTTLRAQVQLTASD